MSLNAEQHYAGASYLDVDDIIYEEFFARTPYLPGEPDKLVNLWSTVDRKRFTTKIWCVGNTISRVCPYIPEWGLHKIISNMKQGDIRTTKIPAVDRLVEEFKKQREEYHASIQELYQIIMTDPTASQYMQAEMRFSLMMNDVYKILGEVMGLGNNQ